LFIFSFFYPPESWKYYFVLPDVEKRQEGEMRVHFLDVGQGDSILIELPDGKTMLVDGGAEGAKTEKTILRYMNALKIKTLDYLLITHADNDHCGAIAEIVRIKKVLNAYLPATYDIQSGNYAEAYAELSKADCDLFEANGTVNLSREGSTPYTLRFLYPYSDSLITGDNEGSAIFWLDYMGVSFLFTGDAPEEVETKLLEYKGMGMLPSSVQLNSTEILKVSHHGSISASSEKFLKYLN
jgi:competence protein ComEC